MLYEVITKAFDFEIKNNLGQSFRWVKIKELDESKITFPIDKYVANKLKETFSK